MMKRWLCIGVLFLVLAGCTEYQPTSDQTQQRQQERALSEGSSKVGMPAIKNFRERKLLKDILEMRDQTGLTTYTYTFAELSGRLVFLCDSIGYPIPYSTQFTNPQKIEDYRANVGYAILPQADPNGLFSPGTAEGSWVMCKDPNGKDVRPVYSEPRLVTSQFKLQ